MIAIDVKNKDAVAVAIKVIQYGGVIIYPTDTIYGFGTDAANDEAIDKLNNIKGRSGPISVLAPDQETALSWSNISNDEHELIVSKLKRQTTVIYPVKKGIVSHKIMGEDGSLGVRIPNNAFCYELSKLSQNPITSTSVNRHGSPPINEPGNILEEIGAEIDLFVDGGSLVGNKGSSIYKLAHGIMEKIRD